MSCKINECKNIPKSKKRVRRVLRRSLPPRTLSEEEKEENKKRWKRLTPPCDPSESDWEAVGMGIGFGNSGRMCHSCQIYVSERDVNEIPVEKMWELGMDCGYVWCVKCCEEPRIRCWECGSLTTERYKTIFPSPAPHVWLKEWL